MPTKSFLSSKNKTKPIGERDATHRPFPASLVCKWCAEGKEPGDARGRGGSDADPVAKKDTRFITSILQNARVGKTTPAGKSPRGEAGKSQLPLQGPELGLFPGTQEPAPAAPMRDAAGKQREPAKQRQLPLYD